MPAPAQRPFRFGVVAESASTGEQLSATARRAEELGYATLSLRDHFVREPFGDQLAPMVALAAVAGATRTLGIGTLVLDNDYRHPVMLAKEAATLDRLSGGRFELGLGAGWLRAEYERAGMTFDPPGVRVARLAESLQILKGLLAGGPVTFSGDHYRIRGLRTFPRPSRRPRPPILVGAGSPRMLRLAGREADIVGILPRALPEGAISDAVAERLPGAIAAKVAHVRDGAGDRWRELELSMIVTPTPAGDPRKAAELVAARRGWGPGLVDQVLTMPTQLLGRPEDMAEQMRTRRERFGFSYYVISDEDLDGFAPVVELVSGT